MHMLKLGENKSQLFLSWSDCAALPASGALGQESLQMGVS